MIRHASKWCLRRRGAATLRLAKAVRLCISAAARYPTRGEWHDRLLAADPPNFFQHIGLYAYRRDFLLQMAMLPRTPLEKLENLEQLRVLESGHAIVVGVVDEPTVGIDTPEDYRAFVERTRRR